MAVRIRIRVRRRGGGNYLSSPALVNAGFEARASMLLLPAKAAELVGFWPPPKAAKVVTLGTAGGPAKHHIIRKALEVEVSAKGAKPRHVVCDAVISGIEDEILLNDKLADALDIVLEKVGAGEWRFRDERRVRKSVRRRFWI